MFLLTAALAVAGCPRAGALPPPAERDDAIHRLEAYRTWALGPAKVPPPSLDSEVAETTDGPVRATARLLRPEDADWNQWAGGPRLFNDRGAVLFEVAIAAPGPVSWLAEASALELNDERTVLPAAVSAEVLLADLLFHAFLEERWALDGDLVSRTRGAGPFRSAYLAPSTNGDTLSGVVAFPLVGPDGPLSDTHVVALRLTVPIVAADGPHELVWIFD